MSITETIARKVEQLPIESQKQVLDFVQSMENKPRPRAPRHDPQGALAAQPFNLDMDDFKEIRKQMSARFPRELPR